MRKLPSTYIVIAIGLLVLIIVAGLRWSRGTPAESSPSTAIRETNTTSETVSIGAPFPLFSVTDVDGAALTNETLRGKPTILWFTTTWCTPCQIGAQKVAQLNKELSGLFNVLVFFVDPRESEDDLRNWRNTYADTDWKLALNNGLAEQIGIQFLDSKYLLDKDGIVKNFNTQLVNEQYLDLLRSTIQ